MAWRPGGSLYVPDGVALSLLFQGIGQQGRGLCGVGQLLGNDPLDLRNPMGLAAIGTLQVAAAFTGLLGCEAVLGVFSVLTGLLGLLMCHCRLCHLPHSASVVCVSEMCPVHCLVLALLSQNASQPGLEKKRRSGPGRQTCRHAVCPLVLSQLAVV